MPYSNKEKQREYQRLWCRKRRAEHLEEQGAWCRECGVVIELEFDHVDPQTKVTHRFISWRKERAREELKKCQVLCWQCHREKSIAEGSLPPPSPHGTHRRYSNLGCRCDICRVGNTVRARVKRARAKARKENH
jgi:hypothetical protein